jgi:hypothetical protein
MKKLITIIIIALSSFVNAQEINIVDSPAYYYLTVAGDTIMPRYTKESKAILRGSVLANIYKGKQVVLERPNGFFTIVDIETTTPESNDILTVLKTDKETVSIDFPNDDTGYFYVINPENKTIIALGKTYKNQNNLTFIQSKKGWERLN